MSYITELQTIYKLYEPNGTFGFRRQFEQDNKMRHIDVNYHPICFIENNTSGTINIPLTPELHDTPNFSIYFLTKYDKNDVMVENDVLDIDKHSKLVEPMLQLGSSVLYQYFVQKSIIKESDRTQFNYQEIFNWGTSDYCGAKFTVNMKRFRSFSCYPD